MGVFWQMDCVTAVGRFSISAVAAPTFAVRYVVKMGVGRDHDGVASTLFLTIPTLAAQGRPNCVGFRQALSGTTLTIHASPDAT